MSPLVTVIISTHNRPETLEQTLRSVRLQTETRWAVLVVGDCCDHRTEEVLQPWLEDPRFAYVNLSLRCGEQALPNSSAMALVSTPYLAWLNHDDLWLPDHLATALRCLQEDRAEIYLGRAAMCHGIQTAGNGAQVPVFSHVSPPQRDLRDVFSGASDLFEPASAWVIRTETARRVGPWRASDDLYRVPLQEWLLRAWREGLCWTTTDTPTCIKVEDHFRAEEGKTLYRQGGELNAGIMDLIDRKLAEESDVSRDFCLLGLTPCGQRHNRVIQRGGKVARGFEILLRWPVLSALYRRFGWDAHAGFSRLLNVRKGRWMAQTLKHRTGENWQRPPSLDVLQSQLALALRRFPNWTGQPSKVIPGNSDVDSRS